MAHSHTKYFNFNFEMENVVKFLLLDSDLYERVKRVSYGSGNLYLKTLLHLEGVN